MQNIKWFWALVLLAILMVAAPVRAQTDFWQKSSVPRGITVNFLTESNDGVLWAGSADYGLWRSKDDGITWAHTGSGLGYSGMFNSLVWPGYNMGMFSGDGNYGIYHSTDSGANFNSWGAPGTGRAAKLFVDGSGYLLSFDGAHLDSYTVRVENGSPVWGWQAILSNVTAMANVWQAPDRTLYIREGSMGSSLGAFYHSVDNGLHCTKIFNEDMYVVTFDHSGNTVYAENNFGIRRSTNSGANWIGPVANPAVDPHSLFASDEGRLIMGTLEGVYISSNQGVTWSRSALDSALIETFFLDSKGTLFAGGPSGLYRSLDTGLTWSPAMSSFPAVPINAMCAFGPGNILVGTAAGKLYRTYDGGVTWNRLTDLAVPALYALSSDPSPTILAGVGNGIIRSTDGGTSWLGATGGDVATHAFKWTDDVHVFAATDKGIYASSDTGKSWIHTGLDSLPVSAINSGPRGRVAACGLRGAYFSTDGGSTWSAAGPGLPGNHGGTAAIALDGSGVMYCGGDSGLYRSIDGAGWTKTTLGNHAVRVLTAAQGNIFAGTDTGVFRSVDYGDTWSLLTFGATKIIATGFTFDPEGFLYVSTTNGVYRSVQTTLGVKELSAPSSPTFCINEISPNPFNERATIRFTIAESGNVELRIVDVLGRTIAISFTGMLHAGTFEMPIDGSRLGSGVYFCCLRSGGMMQAQAIRMER